MKILFLSRWLPFPPSNGSKLRIYNLLQGLAKNHEISLITFAAPEEMGPVPPPLADLCAEVRIVPWAAFDPQSQKARKGFLSTTPRSILDTFSPAISHAISEVLDRDAIELVIASQIDMAAYNNQFKSLPAIFEEAELGVIYERFSRAQALRSKIRSGLTWIKYRRYLDSILPHFNAVTVVSDKEKKLFGQAVRRSPQVYVIPNCVDVTSYQDLEADPQPGTMIFTGSLRFQPNHDAMRWFISEVLPIIQRDVPEATLSITGDHGDLPLPPGDRIIRTGMVPDIRPLVAKSWISVVPIWQGGGTRLKILESMAMKTPVVATRKGAEGIRALSGEDILIGDTPERFAANVISLMSDQDLRDKIACQAYNLVNISYNWETTIPKYEELISFAIENNTQRISPPGHATPS